MATGLITASNLKLRDGPNGSVVDVLVRGERVEVTVRNGDWLRVATLGGGPAKLGWIRSSFLAEEAEPAGLSARGPIISARPIGPASAPDTETRADPRTLGIADHRLTADGKPVLFIKSPSTGGTLPRDTAILVMHFTYGGTARSSAEWFRDPKNPGSSAHVVVDRDGSFVQCVPFDTVAWHAGKSRWKGIIGLNNHALGIELANWGYLQRSVGGWQSYTGTKIAEPVMALHRNGNPHGETTPIGWEPYPDVQFRAAAALARTLIRVYALTEIVGHDDIAPGRKWDPGPAFDMARFRALVFGDRGQDGDTRLKVSALEGLNLRSGPGLDFEIRQVLPAGAIVEPLERQGNWTSVSVINDQGEPSRSGWAHGRFLEPV